MVIPWAPALHTSPRNSASNALFRSQTPLRYHHPSRPRSREMGVLCRITSARSTPCGERTVICGPCSRRRSHRVSTTTIRPCGNSRSTPFSHVLTPMRKPTPARTASSPKSAGAPTGSVLTGELVPGRLGRMATEMLAMALRSRVCRNLIGPSNGCVILPPMNGNPFPDNLHGVRWSIASPFRRAHRAIGRPPFTRCGCPVRPMIRNTNLRLFTASKNPMMVGDYSPIGTVSTTERTPHSQQNQRMHRSRRSQRDGSRDHAPGSHKRLRCVYT